MNVDVCGEAEVEDEVLNTVSDLLGRLQVLAAAAHARFTRGIDTPRFCFVPAQFS